MFKKQIEIIAKRSREATHALHILTTVQKNNVLKDIARALMQNKNKIEQANRRDVQKAKKNGLSPAMIDRLILNPQRIKEMRDAVLQIVKLPDPVGEITQSSRRNGLLIKRVRIPLGVVCMIYESRPNVTIDAAALCFKSGNAVILRGGSEAFFSNQILVNIARGVLKKHKIDPAAVSMIPFTDRGAMIQLLQMARYIDVVIPRGGSGLMQFIADHTRIPVIKHDKGVCSIFIDESADIPKAIQLVENAKVQRPGVCNAVENLFVHQKIAKRFLPCLWEILLKKGVELRGDKKARHILPCIKKATEQDYHTEYLDLILSLKIVKDVRDAICQVIQYSSDHTDGIVTEDRHNADLFVRSIHSSCMMINTSTRMNDGGQLGLGAEIGISTTRIHAYGPMGLRELTTQKFVVESNYRTRS